LEAIHSHIVGYGKYLRRFAQRTPQLLADDEILNGNHLSHFDRMNMDSAPGYPEEMFRPSGEKGKAYLFLRDAGDKYHKLIERPWIAMAVMEKAARANKRVKSVHKPCAKDEKRKWAKIRTGKTRIFNTLPVHETMLMRKYFLDFCVALMNARHEGWCQVGIDPTGPEWTVLYRALRKFGEDGGDGDHREFDGKAFQEYQMEFAECANAFYGDSLENQRVRRVLCNGTIHAYNIIGNLFYQDHQGVPSGTSVTATMNSFINWCYFLMAWRMLARQTGRFEMMDLASFDKNVGFKDFGDDDAFTTNNKILEWFNQASIAQALLTLGLQMTDADKSSEHKTKKLDEFSFLKRAFRSHPTIPNYKLAPLDVDSIQEMTNWIRQSPDPMAALYENLETAAREAYHHGVRYYMEYLSRVNCALEARGLRTITFMYDDMDRVFLSKFDA